LIESSSPRTLDSSSDESAAVSRHILGMRVDATSYRDAGDRIVGWANAGLSRSVCVASVNNVMIAERDPSFLAVMNEADLVTPDGMPLVWGLRWLGVPTASRVYGPDLTPMILSRAAMEGVPVGFVGGTPAVLDKLISKVSAALPDLDVAYRVSPSFDEATSDEEASIAREINSSGARIVFVGLGCPKQELWMARQRGSVRAVMIGVGAAFDFLAGIKPQAPVFVQRSGLEWLFRLVTEPRRLWRRYLHQNPRFVLLFGRQLLADRMQRLKKDDVDRGEAP
jgi:N-acetylglucosaminyldiphosphoundecaprenol N-acetyl-beta-D-mannosaminyltransferase